MEAGAADSGTTGAGEADSGTTGAGEAAAGAAGPGTACAGAADSGAPWAGAVNGAFWAAYWLNLWTFVVGEAVACYVLGTVLLKALARVTYFRPMIPADHLN